MPLTKITAWIFFFFIFILLLQVTSSFSFAQEEVSTTPDVSVSPSPSSQPTTSTNMRATTDSSCVVTKVGNPGDNVPTPVCISSNGQSPIPGDFTYYCQGDPQWNGSNYSRFGEGNTCMLQAGCGPTSLAMIIASFGLPLTPIQVDEVFQDNGWRAGCGAGSSYGPAVYSPWLANLGFTVSDANLAPGGKPDLQLMKQFLDQGYLIINGADNYPCLGCVTQGLPVGHVFVIDAVDIEGKRVRTRDPNNCNFASGEELTNQAWVMVESDSVQGTDTSPFNAVNATWNGSFAIKFSQ